MTEREKIVKIIQSVEKLHARYIHCIDHNDDIQLVTREEAIADALLERSRKSIGGYAITNNEKINNMTVEEKSKWICSIQDCRFCSVDKDCDRDTECKAMQKWLRSVAVT